MNDLIVLLVLGILGLGGAYAFVYMPRQRDFVSRQRMARELVEGDEVITGGGMVGIVRDIDASKGVAYIEIADGIVVRVLTAALLSRYDAAEIAKNAQIGQAEPVKETD